MVNSFYNSSSIMNMVPRDEQIVWYGKPNKTCYILEAIFNPLLFVALIWGGIDIMLIINAQQTEQSGPILFFAIHMLPVWIYLYGALLSGLRYKNTEYVITDKKIYVSTGVFKKSCKKKLYRQINRIEMNQGLFDKNLHVGDVEMTDPNDYYRTKHGIRYNKLIIADIPDYQKVYKLISGIHGKHETGEEENLVENPDFDYQGDYSQEDTNNYLDNNPYGYYDNPDRRIDL